MVLFNYATKEITAKIVYYGPGLCGKTTNLQFVYDSLPSNNKSKMLSLATKTDRTLFFDFLPLDLGKIRGMRTKLQLYTVPGQVYYNSTRQLVLKGADGIVFVADSQDFAVDANLESLQNLEDNLKRQGIRIREIPVVLQYNKRDLPNALPVEELEKEVNKLHAPHFSSVATTGIGVEETLKGITQLVLTHLVKKYGLEGSEPLDKEIQILNVTVPREKSADSLWDDDDDEALPAAATPPIPSNPYTVADADDDEDIPLVATELIGSTTSSAATATAPPPAPTPAARAPQQPSPFSEVDDYFATSAPAPAPPPVAPPAPAAAPAPAASKRFSSPFAELPMEVPMASIEIPLPAGILNSLPDLDEPLPPQPAATAPVERRATDGLVKEISIPLNLSLDEIRQHRRLRLKITLDINLLP
jgi:signal recognition particle receptor subunit beta